MAEIELRTFYYSSGEYADTPAGDICGECYGMGRVTTHEWPAVYTRPCEHCNGIGLEPEEMRCDMCDGFGLRDLRNICCACHGTGKLTRPNYNPLRITWPEDVSVHEATRVVDKVKSEKQQIIAEKLQDALEGQYVVEVDFGIGDKCRGRVLEVTNKAADNWRTMFVFRAQDGRSHTAYIERLVSVERCEFVPPWDKPQITCDLQRSWRKGDKDQEQGIKLWERSVLSHMPDII